MEDSFLSFDVNLRSTRPSSIESGNVKNSMYGMTSDNFGTNSELDVSQFLKKIHIIEEDLPEFDETLRTYYKSQCKYNDVVPSDIFLRNIETDTLNMPHYGLRAKGIIPIANTLIHNKTISKINLSDNWLCDEGVINMMPMVKINDVITELDLSCNQLTEASSQILSENLANSPILLRLNLSHNKFNDNSANNFGDLMMLSLRLEYLNLSYNYFGSGSLGSFGKAFGQTTSILHLDLSFNCLGGSDEEIKKFTKGLTKNACIRHLNLSSNGFSSKEGVSSFGKMLKQNTCLEELNLSNNHIGTEAVVQFAKSLNECFGLQVLRIGRNPIMSAGCYAIVNFILKNKEPKFYILDFESVHVNNDFRTLADKLIQYIPDILILTGVRLVSRVFPDVDPLKRMKYMSVKLNINLFQFFQKYQEDDQSNFVTLDKIKVAIDDFCEENQFKLIDFDKRRLFKSFPRNQDRVISFKVLAKMLDEEYTEKIEEEEEEVVEMPKEKVEDESLDEL